MIDDFLIVTKKERAPTGFGRQAVKEELSISAVFYLTVRLWYIWVYAALEFRRGRLGEGAFDILEGKSICIVLEERA